MSTGYMQEKKALYLIPEIDENKDSISIPEEDIDNFRRDYESRKNQVEAVSKTFFNLPENGRKKPAEYKIQAFFFRKTAEKSLYFIFSWAENYILDLPPGSGFSMNIKFQMV